MYPKLLLDENVPDETAFHWTFDWKMSCLREPTKSSLDATNLFLSPRSFIIYWVTAFTMGHFDSLFRDYLQIFPNFRSSLLLRSAQDWYLLHFCLNALRWPSLSPTMVLFFGFLTCFSMRLCLGYYQVWKDVPGQIDHNLLSRRWVLPCCQFRQI